MCATALIDTAVKQARAGGADAVVLRFALAEPGLFATAFACARPKDGAPGQAPYGVLSTVLDELVTTGVLSAERRPGADVTCWAAVHRFAVLCLQGPLRELSEQEREAQLDGLLERVARGL